MEFVLLVLILLIWRRYVQLSEQHKVEREQERKQRFAVQVNEARRTLVLRRKRLLRRQVLSNVL